MVARQPVGASAAGSARTRVVTRAGLFQKKKKTVAPKKEEKKSSPFGGLSFGSKPKAPEPAPKKAGGLGGLFGGGNGKAKAAPAKKQKAKAAAPPAKKASPFSFGSKPKARLCRTLLKFHSRALTPQNKPSQRTRQQ